MRAVLRRAEDGGWCRTFLLIILVTRQALAVAEVVWTTVRATGPAVRCISYLLHKVLQ